MQTLNNDLSLSKPLVDMCLYLSLSKLYLDLQLQFSNYLYDNYPTLFAKLQILDKQFLNIELYTLRKNRHLCKVYKYRNKYCYILSMNQMLGKINKNKLVDLISKNNLTLIKYMMKNYDFPNCKNYVYDNQGYNNYLKRLGKFDEECDEEYDEEYDYSYNEIITIVINTCIWSTRESTKYKNYEIFKYLYEIYKSKLPNLTGLILEYDNIKILKYYIRYNYNNVKDVVQNFRTVYYRKFTSKCFHFLLNSYPELLTNVVIPTTIRNPLNISDKRIVNVKLSANTYVLWKTKHQFPKFMRYRTYLDDIIYIFYKFLNIKYNMIQIPTVEPKLANSFIRFLINKNCNFMYLPENLLLAVIYDDLELVELMLSKIDNFNLNDVITQSYINHMITYKRIKMLTLLNKYGLHLELHIIDELLVLCNIVNIIK